MANFEINGQFKTHFGTWSGAATISFDDSNAWKLENSSYHSEVLSQVEAALPSTINGTNWRTQGYKLVSFSARKQ